MGENKYQVSTRYLYKTPLLTEFKPENFLTYGYFCYDFGELPC
jgi:hypothetical protein